MNTQPIVQYASRTDVGMRRAVNQDAQTVRLCDNYNEWVRCGHLFVVADGMGGHSVGELASQIVVDVLPMAYQKAEVESIEQRIRVAIRGAHRAIQVKAHQNPEFADMGTTCSLLALSDQGAWIGHVGDSRVYRIRGALIEQLTFDHSLQWEVIRRGQTTPEAAELLHPRNVITRCLGPDEQVEIDIEGPFDVQPGDCFVLCSDGLTGHVTDAEIGRIVSELSVAESAWLLVDLANCRGGSDNTTVVVAAVEDYPGVSGTPVDASAGGAEFGSHPGSGRVQVRWFVAVLAVMAAVGLVLLAAEKKLIGLAFVATALLTGLGRLLFLFFVGTHRGADLGANSDSSSPTEETTGLNGKGIAPRSPYRRSSLLPQSQFLSLLSSAQSELTDAARDNGWEIDYDQLEKLASFAARSDGQGGGLRARAQAMKILMKEFCARLRPGSK